MSRGRACGRGVFGSELLVPFPPLPAGIEGHGTPCDARSPSWSLSGRKSCEENMADGKRECGMAGIGSERLLPSPSLVMFECALWSAAPLGGGASLKTLEGRLRFSGSHVEGGVGWRARAVLGAVWGRRGGFGGPRKRAAASVASRSTSACAGFASVSGAGLRRRTRRASGAKCLEGRRQLR